ncbi:putative class III homeodomain-leucine zipper family [Helianthus debilis subsp. tardiflorus]
MARQYVRSVINSVQRVAMAISPSGLSPCVGPKTSPGSPEALTLAQWICQSYMYHLGADLLSSGAVVGESLLKDLWQHQDAILCCSLKALRYIRQIAQESSGEVVYGLGRQLAVLRTLSQRLSRLGVLMCMGAMAGAYILTLFASCRIIWLLMLLMVSKTCLSEPSLAPPTTNDTRWELLEAAANRIHIEDGSMTSIPPGEHHYYLWNPEHFIQTSRGSLSIFVYGDQEKPPLITYPCSFKPTILLSRSSFIAPS